MKPVQMLFLGSGDAFSAGGRHQAAYLVRSEHECLLLDCGASVLGSLKRDGIAPDHIDTVLISHLHGDHFAGLPFLFLEYTYVETRRRPLAIAGPPGTEERVGALFRAMYGETGSQSLPFPLKHVEMRPETPVRIGNVRVDPFRVPHQEKDISLGFVVQLEGRRILYSGDTGWTEDLVVRSDKTDLFVCECSFFETRTSTHLDYPRLAENRHRFGAKRTILTHLGSEVLARSREVHMEMARDGMVVEV